MLLLCLLLLLLSLVLVLLLEVHQLLLCCLPARLFYLDLRLEFSNLALQSPQR